MTAGLKFNPALGQWVQAVDATETVTTSGAAQTLDTGRVQKVTLTAACTFTMPAAGTFDSLFVYLTQDGTGSRTATFTGVKWAAGTPPTLTTTAAAVDVLRFDSDGTSVIVGSVVGKAIA